ncbi:MAG: hypothetical protein ACLRFH_03170 [Opitutales bacterium]
MTNTQYSSLCLAQVMKTFRGEISTIGCCIYLLFDNCDSRQKRPLSGMITRKTLSQAKA